MSDKSQTDLQMVVQQIVMLPEGQDKLSLLKDAVGEASRLEKARLEAKKELWSKIENGFMSLLTFSAFVFLVSVFRSCSFK